VDCLRSRIRPWTRRSERTEHRRTRERQPSFPSYAHARHSPNATDGDPGAWLDASGLLDVSAYDLTDTMGVYLTRQFMLLTSSLSERAPDFGLMFLLPLQEHRHAMVYPIVGVDQPGACLAKPYAIFGVPAFV
jgi:hypothetical protein